MEDTDLGEDIEMQELVWFFLVTEGIGGIGCFRIVLASGVLIEIVEAANRVVSVKPSQDIKRRVPVYVRKTAMRRNPLEETQSNL